VAAEGSAAVAPADREALKRELFRLWDRDGDGALKKSELLQLARATGFDGTDQEWDVEYPDMCAEKGCMPETGLPEEAVMALLDDDSDVGCYFTDAELAEIMREALARCGDDVAKASPGPAASTVAATGSPIAEASPSGSGAGDSPMPEAAGATDADDERGALKRRLFALWDRDKDGFLKKDELLLLARATGFEGSVEEWEEAEYPKMCAENGCLPDDGLAAASVMALLDDDSENGCYFSNDELREILDEAVASTAAPMEVEATAGGSSSSSSSSTGVLEKKEQRDSLKRKLFRLWDQDKDGFLNGSEMMQVALATGFDGTDEEWAAEFQAMCEERKIQPEKGLPKASVLALLDDESEQGAFLPTEELKRLVEVLQGGEPDPEDEEEFKVTVVRDAKGKAGFSVRQADLLITNLTRAKELQPMQNGDVILAVNGSPISCFADYTKAAHGAKEFVVTIRRPRHYEDADAWAGARPGYCFKLGEHGLGYYRDVRDGVFAVMTGVQEFHPSKHFEGEWTGYVFKRGHLGVGYYLDRVSRMHLKRRLFELWDTDRDGRLNKQEACQFARDSGFTGEFQEFEQEFERMCKTRQCDPAQGLSQNAVSDMLEDKTDRGCYIPSDAMGELIAQIEKALASGKRSAPTTSTTPLVEIPIARLKALAKLHGVSLAGCVEKSEIVETLRKAGVADQGAAAVAAAAEKHFAAGNSSKDQQAASEERGATAKRISLCDEKGELRKNSVVKMAGCVGWIGEDSTWFDAFAKVFKDSGCTTKGEMSVVAVMALAEAAKQHLLEKNVGASDVGDESAKKKQKVLPPKKKDVERKCEACEGATKELATRYCQNCKAFLCKACDDENHITPLLKKHRRVSAHSSSGYAVGIVIPVYKQLSAMSVAELKDLAKKHKVDIAACVEKKDIVATLEKNDVKVEVPQEASSIPDGPNSLPTQEATGQKKVTPPGKKAPPEKPGDIKPMIKPKPGMQETAKLLEVYQEYKDRMAPGTQWELQTGVALWRNDFGWERTVYINAKTPSGWPSIIEVLEYGERRLKVRGMGINRSTGTFVGQKWQMGWLEVALLVDKDTGELLATPNTKTGQIIDPKPKAGTGKKVLPKSHPESKESQKEKEGASKDPEAGSAKPEGLEKADVFSKSEDF